jgi:hypothetical protein
MAWKGVNPAVWADEQQDNILAVFQRAVVLLGRELIRTKADGGNLPKVSGNLMRSLLAQIGGIIEISDAKDFAATDVGIIAATAILGDEIVFGYQAAYARRMNYGFVGDDKLGREYNQSGNHFVERAINLWPSIVDQAIRDVKNGSND